MKFVYVAQGFDVVDADHFALIRIGCAVTCAYKMGEHRREEPRPGAHVENARAYDKLCAISNN